MADPTLTVQAINPAPAPVVVAPTLVAPVTAPAEVIQTPIAQPTQVPAPVVEVAPVVAVEAVVPEAPVTPTLLGDPPKAPAPVEPPAPVAPQTPEVVQTETAPTPPVYEPFKTPEGTTFDTERLGKFTELLSGLEMTGKADHAAVQEFGQKAVDFHINEINRTSEELTKLYQTTWERQKTDWKDSFLKDPEIGGSNSDNSLVAANSFIITHGGTPEQQQEFRNLMNTSGIGNHPAMIRILAKAGLAMSEGRPLTAVKPLAPIKSKIATMYGSK